MKETNEINCSKCHIKVEPVFSLFNKENPNYKKLINNVNKYIAE